MRALIIAIAIAMPLAAAQAAEKGEPIPDETLAQHNQACVQQCVDDGKTWSTCNRTCGCITDEIARHWGKSDYMSHEKMMGDAKKAPEVRDKMARVANYCRKQVSAQ